MNTTPNKLSINVENLEVSRVRSMLLKPALVDPLVAVFRAMAGEESRIDVKLSVKFGLVSLTITETDE